MSDAEYIQQRYDLSPDIEESRLDIHQLEWDLTWKFLNEYLPPTGHILDIGSGTGKYSVALAQRGYHVTGIDLSKPLLDKAIRRAQETGVEDRIVFIHGDARSLKDLITRRYDAVLLMGPLYHLTCLENRERVVQQVCDSLQNEGVLFSAFLSKYGIFSEVLKEYPEWILHKDQVDFLMHHGIDSPHTAADRFQGYYATIDEIFTLHTRNGITPIALGATKPVIGSDDESYNRLKGTLRKDWLHFLYSICREEHSLGASSHLLFVGRKGRDNP